MFGSEGLFAFDVNGTELWRQGSRVACRSASPTIPTYEWGPASSPVIHGSTVVVQNDRYKDSFLIAFDLSHRQRAVAVAPRRAALVDDAARPRRRCDADRRDQLAAVHPRPRSRDGTRALARRRSRRPGQGQHADRCRRTGHRDGRLSVGGPADPRHPRRATDRSRGARNAARPIPARRSSTTALLYIVTDNGILSAYQIADGTRVYQQRLPPEAGAFSASPVAAAGRIYLASEDGQVFVVRAGPHLRVAGHQRHERGLHGDAGPLRRSALHSHQNATSTRFAVVTGPVLRRT